MHLHRKISDKFIKQSLKLYLSYLIHKHISPASQQGLCILYKNIMNYFSEQDLKSLFIPFLVTIAKVEQISESRNTYY